MNIITISTEIEGMETRIRNIIFIIVFHVRGTHRGRVSNGEPSMTCTSRFWRSATKSAPDVSSWPFQLGFELMPVVLGEEAVADAELWPTIEEVLEEEARVDSVFDEWLGEAAEDGLGATEFWDPSCERIRGHTAFVCGWNGEWPNVNSNTGGLNYMNRWNITIINE